MTDQLIVSHSLTFVSPLMYQSYHPIASYVGHQKRKYSLRGQHRSSPSFAYDTIRHCLAQSQSWTYQRLITSSDHSFNGSSGQALVSTSPNHLRKRTVGRFQHENNIASAGNKGNERKIQNHADHGLSYMLFVSVRSTQP